MTAEGYLNKKEIIYVLEDALELFNNKYNTNYNQANIHIDFFKLKDFPEVYERFCRDRFPRWLREDYTNPDFYKYTYASAFVEGDNFGILIRSSAKFVYGTWLEIILHELGHIFATTHEYDGDYYHEYCEDDSPVENPDMHYMGYTMWKEFIAEFLAQNALPPKTRQSLCQSSDKIIAWDEDIIGTDKTSMSSLGRMLAAIFTTTNFYNTDEWKTFESEVSILWNDRGLLYKSICQDIFYRLKAKKDNPHIISPDFIFVMGEHVFQITRLKYQSTHNRLTADIY